jgi:hypothetical protein
MMENKVTTVAKKTNKNNTHIHQSHYQCTYPLAEDQKAVIERED